MSAISIGMPCSTRSRALASACSSDNPPGQQVQKGLMGAETRSGATSAAISSTLLCALAAATVRSNNHEEVAFNPQRCDMRLTCEFEVSQPALCRIRVSLAFASTAIARLPSERLTSTGRSHRHRRRRPRSCHSARTGTGCSAQALYKPSAHSGNGADSSQAPR